MACLPISLDLETWAYRRPFAISRGVLTEQTVMYAHADTPWGVIHGEGEPHESDVQVAFAMRHRGLAFIAGLNHWPTRWQLRDWLPADGLRNALDAMLWDHESKQKGVRAWELAGFDGVDENTTVPTMVTVTLDEPQAMAEIAAHWKFAPIIKLKLGDRSEGGLDRDIERTLAVANAVPEAELVIDANEGWTRAALLRFVSATRHHNICLIEQPLPAGSEDLYDDLHCSVPLAADESCTSMESLNRVQGRFQYVNLKLDKCGGLTEALEMVRRARDLKLGVMIGCNCGTSLAMASAFVLATQCDLVDLDGPLHLQADRQPPIEYQSLRMRAPARALWG